MKYKSGEEVQINDQVLIKGEPARVEFIVLDEHSPEQEWYFKTIGPGVMFHSTTLGDYYCGRDVLFKAEDIDLVCRGKKCP